MDNELLGAGSVLPRWNYKKADWSMFKHLTSVRAEQIVTEGRDINNIVKDFTACILQTAKETIPRGAYRNYKPYWSDDLEKLQEEVEATRKQTEDDPNQEHHKSHQHAKARFQRAKLQARRKSWREKTEKLNMDRDGRKLWKLVKQLSDEGTTRATKITLQENGGTLTGKQAANLFAQMFAEDSRTEVPQERKRAVRQNRQAAAGGEVPEMMNLPLTLRELELAQTKLKVKKSPGADGISNEMIKNLGSAARTKLLAIFNLSWVAGEVPQNWREAIMVPLHKHGKDGGLASSYRPISLTSCLCKTMERIINHRLKWHLESGNYLAPQQAGFRQCYCTEDQATYLAQDIEDAFQAKQLVMATWIDLRKAFDKVWKEGLLLKMRECNVGGRMYKWTKSFLHNRRAKVQLDGCKSRKVLLQQGVPQGGVLSPTLFLIFINDLISEIPHGVRTAMYADDLVMWCTDEYATTATKRMQRAADALTAWARKWCVSINTEKSSTTTFTLSQKQKSGKIYVEGKPLIEDNQPTYLGVTFDGRLTWRPQISKAETKARRKLAIMRKLSGTTWGASADILKKVYQQGVRPHLEYGSTAWGTAATTTLQGLDRIQNQALRIITGALKSTPIARMEETTNIQPLKERRDTRVIVHGEKFKSTPNHPMAEKFKNISLNRLKRSSFVHQAKRLRRQIPELPQVSIPLSTVPEFQPWTESAGNRMTINSTLKGVKTKMDNQNDLQKRTAALSLIDEEFPRDLWIRVYTDGSAERAIQNGGAGVLIEYPDHTSETISIPTGKFCNNFDSEVKAISAAAAEIQNLNDSHPTVFLTDAKSVLESLESGKVPHLDNDLSRISNKRKIVLQWIPSHCGIPGNERADELAKEGTRLEQPDLPVSYHQKKMMVKSIRKPSGPTRDDYHLLDRNEQVIIFRLRTGHNRLRGHMFTRFKIGNTALCQCGQEPQTVEHILQNCINLSALRLEYWPNDTDLESKLYGAACQLSHTVKYIHETNLQI